MKIIKKDLEILVGQKQGNDIGIPLYKKYISFRFVILLDRTNKNEEWLCSYRTTCIENENFMLIDYSSFKVLIIVSGEQFEN